MAINPLNADLNVIQALVIPELGDDLDIIQKLDDEPNDVGGLTAAELKAKFDESGNVIQRYINGTLLPAISDTVVEAEERDKAEAERLANEAARVTAEQGRVSAEDGRVDAENARVQAEAGRVSTESARAQVEDVRVREEQGRAQAEDARAQAERGRVDSEAARVTAESGRVDAETLRAQAESLRAQGEGARKTAEDGRVRQEAARVEAETARAAEEGKRSDAERARAQAEQQRSTAESGRGTAEGQRVEAESARAAAEEARVSAETARTGAEADRAAAEQARADENTGIVARATAQAQAAADSAQDAAAAKTEAQSAREAAGVSAAAAQQSATAAGASATAAAGSASTAGVKATEAANSAAAAAESALEAEGVALYPPKMQGDNWWVWDAATNAYKDSGIPARGPQGPQGPQGPAGAGSGDMLVSVYDPTGKARDVFGYVDARTPWEVETEAPVLENVVVPGNGTVTFETPLTLAEGELYYLDSVYTENNEVVRSRQTVVVDSDTAGVLYIHTYFGDIKAGQGNSTFQSDVTISKLAKIIKLAAIPEYLRGGYLCIASGLFACADGVGNIASGNYSHAEGGESMAHGYASHAAGLGATASGQASHAEGFGSTAEGEASHAEGYGSYASGNWSHAEGSFSQASGEVSHAEGSGAIASGGGSHAEGLDVTASGMFSHAEGEETTAGGEASHAEGYGTTATSLSQHVQGEYNVVDQAGAQDARGTYAHIVGNGTSNTPSNAHTLDWSGNGWFAGEVFVGGTGQDDPAAVKLAKVSDIAALPVKKLVGTVENPIDLDTLTEPGRYYLEGELVGKADPKWGSVSGFIGYGAPVDVVNVSGQNIIQTITAQRTMFTRNAGSDLQWKVFMKFAIADTAKSVDATLLASAWTGTAAPFTQTVSVEGVYSYTNGDIGLAQSATAEQRAAAREAMLCITGQASGSLTVTADGVKPTVDIPVTITILG